MFTKRTGFLSEINLSFHSGVEINLVKQTQATKLSGLNKKKEYKDTAGHAYIAKIEKERKLADIFSKSVPTFWYEAKSNITRYIECKQELSDMYTCHGLIASSIANKIFKDCLIVPENYLCCINNCAMILSKKIEGFSEFLKDNDLITRKNPISTEEWVTLPERIDLHLTEAQENILGKLYFIGLLFGHYDLFNNINLSNSGYIVQPDGKFMAVIVDWENSMGKAFGGLSAGEVAFKNSQIINNSNLKENDPLTGFSHVVPFDIIVYPLMPRQIIPELFDISSNKPMLDGFREAYMCAKKYFNKDVINFTIKKIFDTHINQKDVKYFKKILNQELFFGKESDNPTYPRALANLLEGRLISLGEILKELELGKNIEDIAREQLDKIIKGQSAYVSRSHLSLRT